jgi:hypothetical protein
MPRFTTTPSDVLKTASDLFSKRFTRSQWDTHPERPVGSSTIINWFGMWSQFLDQVEFATTKQDEVLRWAQDHFTDAPTREQWDVHPDRPVHSDTMQNWMGWNRFLDQVWGTTRLSARATDEEVRVWLRNNTDRNDMGCWLMRTAPSSNGYGRLTRAGKTLASHQVSHELFHGAVPNGYVIRHTCDTPKCCNPNHLTTGTRSENARDYVVRAHVARCGGSRPNRPQNLSNDAMATWLLSVCTKQNDCMIFPTPHPASGYVSIRLQGGNWQAHRFIRCHLDGLSKGHPMLVRHTCHNRACLNPDHLVWGTAQENRLDDIERGKNQKITPIMRSSILSEWNRWSHGKTDFDRYMATKFKVSTGAIRNIRIAPK